MRFAAGKFNKSQALSKCRHELWNKRIGFVLVWHTFVNSDEVEALEPFEMAASPIRTGNSLAYCTKKSLTPHWRFSTKISHFVSRILCDFLFSFYLSSAFCLVDNSRPSRHRKCNALLNNMDGFM